MRQQNTTQAWSVIRFITGEARTDGQLKGGPTGQQHYKTRGGPANQVTEKLACPIKSIMTRAIGEKQNAPSCDRTPNVPRVTNCTCWVTEIGHGGHEDLSWHVPPPC
ncbi:hypothetical protein BaRGS_00007663 [Batillaria attramentaria]|uniref:Uncharacterized protein n=1 Tax=Batillaria attramentaria TaxID=370345 RepID=A0ABD0LPM8_9CAEN